VLADKVREFLDERQVLADKVQVLTPRQGFGGGLTGFGYCQQCSGIG